MIDNGRGPPPTIGRRPNYRVGWFEFKVVGIKMGFLVLIVSIS